METVARLREELGPDCRQVLTHIWKQFLREKTWQPSRSIHSELGKEFVVRALASTNGSVVYETNSNGVSAYQLVGVGPLLTEDGLKYSDLLLRYLGFLRSLYQEAPEQRTVTNADVVKAMALSTDECNVLYHLIMIGRLYSNSAGSGADGWSVGVFDESEDFPDGDLKMTLEGLLLRNYNSSYPIFYKNQMTSLTQPKVVGNSVVASSVIRPPKVFISYSHESSEHKRWVLDLAVKLREAGIDTVLDEWDLRLGSDVAKYMEDEISAADRVLLICTETYSERVDSRKGGVGYEATMVIGQLLDSLETTKFIPVIRQKSSMPKVPKAMKSRIYVNLSHASNYDQQFESLLRDLHGAPRNLPPQIGPNPFIGVPDDNSGQSLNLPAAVTSKPTTMGATANISSQAPETTSDLDLKEVVDNLLAENRIHKERMLNLIATGEAIAFVGAGLSLAVGYPGWPQLLTKLAKEAEDLGGYVTPSDTIQSDTLAYAEHIRGHFDHCNQRHKYHAFIGTEYGHRSPAFSENHARLVQLPFKGFITTNYDLALEAALGSRHLVQADSPIVVKRNGQDAHKVLDFLLSLSDGQAIHYIAHLHGCQNCTDDIILTASDYREAYGMDYNSVSSGKNRGQSWTLHRKLAWGLMATRRMIFWGFSLTDPYILGMLDAVAEDLWNVNRCVHYAVVPLDRSQVASCKTTETRFLKKYGIQLVFFDNVTTSSYRELDNLIVETTSMCPPKTSQTSIQDVPHIDHDATSKPTDTEVTSTQTPVAPSDVGPDWLEEINQQSDQDLTSQ